MLDPGHFVAGLETAGIHYVFGVPDSLLKSVCACITANLPADRHVIATNEGSAVGLAVGQYLATGRPALVYMQNSGLGNAINPLVSLCDPAVCGIPMVLMVGWRGELDAKGRQLGDEPQHVVQGRVTLQLLDLLDIPCRVIDGCAVVETTLQELVAMSMARSGPVVLLVRKQTFAPFATESQIPEGLSREEAIAAVVSALPDNTAIVATTGMASRELFELRRAHGQGHQRDFLTVGGMGHASQIATGVALAKPCSPVVCLDGDGALLMHMGSLAISADRPNILHILINNHAHDSVGGQPTKGETLDFARLAKACGYGSARRVRTRRAICEAVRAALQSGASALVEVLCRRGSRSELGRPDRSPTQNKEDFMEFLRGQPNA